MENKKKKKDFSPRKKHLKSEIAKYGGVNENFRLTIRATVGSSLAVSWLVKSEGWVTSGFFTHLNLSGPRWWCWQSRFGRDSANSRFYPKAPSGSPRCFLASKFPLAFSFLLLPLRSPFYPVTPHRVHFRAEPSFLLRPTRITFLLHVDFNNAFQQRSTFLSFFPFIRVNGSRNFHPTTANFHSFERATRFLAFHHRSFAPVSSIFHVLLRYVYTLYLYLSIVDG